MSAEINPAAAGIGGALLVLLGQFIWGRVVGVEKSIPVQLAEINAQLALIRSDLLLAQSTASFFKKEFDELKDDFWAHVEKHHDGTSPGIAKYHHPHRPPIARET